jgi:hypothetical protein
MQFETVSMKNIGNSVAGYRNCLADVSCVTATPIKLPPLLAGLVGS